MAAAAAVVAVRQPQGVPAGPAVAAPGPPPFGSYPIAYKVQVSMDGKNVERAGCQGDGSPATSIGDVPAVAGEVRARHADRPAETLRRGRC